MFRLFFSAPNCLNPFELKANSRKTCLRLFLWREQEGVVERGVWEREPNEIRMYDVRMSRLGLSLPLHIFLCLGSFSILPNFLFRSVPITFQSVTHLLFQMVCFCTVQLRCGHLPILLFVQRICW